MMEENKHNDHLDDYVRKSFDDYEAAPSVGAWELIEQQLAPVPPAGISRSWLHDRQRIVATALLLLFSGLVCTHLYYRKEIKTQAVAGQEQQQGKQVKPVEVIENQSNGVQQAEAKKQMFVYSARRPNGQFPQSDVPSGIRSGTVQDVKPVSPATSFRGQEPETTESRELPLPGAKENMPVKEEAFGNIPALGYTETDLKIDRIAPLNPVPAFIKPVHEPSGWYAGFHVTPGFAVDDVRQLPVRPGQRPLFASRQEKPDLSLEWWLRAGKKFNRHFSVETGIGYREISRQAVHSPRFRFGDGASNPGGQARNFNYDLRTYGGSATISLRMEQVDTSTPVADDEPVVLRVRTSEHMQIVRIPLLLAYRMGKGRVTGVMKAGLTGNFVLKNELNVAARKSQNNRLRLAQGNGAFNYRFENSGAFFPGYIAAAGLELRLLRHFSLVTEATLSGDFPRRDVFGRKLPGLLAPGLNTGLNYYF